MKNHYIQAVLELIKAGKTPEEVLVGLNRVLVAKSHLSLHQTVLEGVLRILEAKSGQSGAIVTVVKAADVEQHTAAIKHALTKMGSEESYVVKEDKTLIGGFVAESQNVVHDASYKSALVDLYRKVAN